MRKLLLLIILVGLFAPISAAPEMRTYTVVFNIDDGYAITQTIDSGKNIILPSPPKKNGFVFIGWEQDGKIVDFSKPIMIREEPLIFVAKWMSEKDYVARQDSINWVKMKPNVKNTISQEVSSLKSEIRVLLILLLFVFLFLIALTAFLVLQIFHLNRISDNLRQEIDKANDDVKKIDANISMTNSHQDRSISEDDKQQVRRLFDEWLHTHTEQSLQKVCYPMDNKQNQIKNQPQILYADSIYNGEFTNVHIDPNSDTIFELHLDCSGDDRAKITVYQGARRKILANPSFLEGCEKSIDSIEHQLSEVKTIREGEATKMSNGKWKIKSSLSVSLQ